MTNSCTAPHAHRIAYFISPHGFGHAARAAGIMAAMQESDASIRFEIFTQVPRWFFDDSLASTGRQTSATGLSALRATNSGGSTGEQCAVRSTSAFGYHELLTDIGLVQKTSLIADLPATLRRLGDFFPFDHAKITALARRIQSLKCAMIVCDIAPLGIAVAQEAGIPSVLVENFTWDWIYQEYAPHESAMGAYIDYLRDVFGAADYHVQTEPVCDQYRVDLTTWPVSRKTRMPATQVRDLLTIPHGAKTVMLTMGGIPAQYPFLHRLADLGAIFFVIPGGSTSMQIRENVILLPHHTKIFHPDLVNACDVVIGKAGYSTVAEVYHAGIPFGYITRQRFRESHILAAYIDKHMRGLPITQAQFHDGSWLSSLPELLALPRMHRSHPNGADQAARFLYQILCDGDRASGGG
jgi:hypothetical protein